MEIAFKQVYDNNVQNHILWYMLFFKKLNKTIKVLRYKLFLSHYWKIVGHICNWNNTAKESWLN